MKIVTRKEALAQGLKWYYTGKPCKHGHLSVRRTTTKHCNECHSQDRSNRKEERDIHDAWYRENNREYINNRQKEYRKRIKKPIDNT